MERGGLAHAGSVALNVTADIDDLIITVPNPVTVTGRVRVENGVPADLTRVRVQLQRSLSDSETYALKPGGAFQLDQLTPAHYTIRAISLPDGFCTKRVLAESTDITVSGIDLKAGVPSSIDVWISPKAGRISGVVLDPESRQPAQGATVVLIPKDKRLLRLTEQSTAGVQGEFQFTNLAPGDYQLYTWREVESGAWLDPEFLAPFEEKAIAVSVTEGSQSSPQLFVIAPPAVQTK